MSNERLKWSPERIESLRKHWLAGSSASRIAELLGGTTRNAVISKLHRLGLTAGTHLRKKPGTGSAPVPRIPSGINAKRSAAKQRRSTFVFGRPENQRSVPSRFQGGSSDLELPVEQVEELVVEPSARRGIADLEPNQCRWPIGDPMEPEFHFCHLTQIGGMSYCEHHARRAYQAPSVPQRRRLPAGTELEVSLPGSKKDLVEA